MITTQDLDPFLFWSDYLSDFYLEDSAEAGGGYLILQF